MSIKINNQDIVAINKGNQVIIEVYKGSDLIWQLNTDTDPLDRIIYFADPEVGRVLHANGLIAKAYKTSKRELSQITSISDYFRYNEVITKFPELQYCTGLTELIQTFDGCSNLTEITIPDSITSVDLYNSNIQNIELSNTTIYSKLWLPSSLTELKLLNSVGDFKIKSATNLTSIWIENTSNVNGFALATTANNSGSLQKLRLIGIDETNKYSQLMGLSELIGISSTGSSTSIGQAVTGNVHFEIISQSKLDSIIAKYPNIIFTYNEMVNDNGVPDYFVLATDDDFSGTGDGNFKYIGNDEYVLIPKVIKGVTITKTKYMFGENSPIVSGVGLEAGNSVTDMSYMFYKCSTTKLNLKYFDTSNVVNMSYMFYWTKMYQMNLSSFDTSKVVNMSNMFNQCTYTAFMNLSSFDTSNVTNMSYMFNNCNWLQTLDLSSFNTINVTNMSYMFNTTFNSEGSLILDVTSFDTSNVVSMNNMFETCRLKELDLGSFDTSSISTSNMNRVFFNSKIERCYVRSGDDLRKFRYDDSFIPYKLKFIIRPIII